MVTCSDDAVEAHCRARNGQGPFPVLHRVMTEARAIRPGFEKSGSEI